MDSCCSSGNPWLFLRVRPTKNIETPHESPCIEPMNDQEAFGYLAGLQSRGMRLDLTVFQESLHGMSEPHNDYPSILVGGTNGKGSICAMTTAMLVSAGLRVGLYTSPHLVDVRERVRLNGEMISMEDMADCIRTVKRFTSDSLTYFEFLTALAFLFFARQKVDVAVLEVGMGGRLDATNVVHPVVSVVSNISLEHCAYLGNRLTDIAGEKAGIIKRGGVCLTGASQKPVLEVLEKSCLDQGADFYRLGRDLRIGTSRRPGCFTYRGLATRYDHLPCPLVGRHQIRNAALAVGATEILSRIGLEVGETAIREGLGRARWAGRLEVWPGNPTLVLDGAHNPAGIAALCRALKEHFRYERLFVVFGVLADKDCKAMLSKLARLAHTLILTRPAADRARSPREVAFLARGLVSNTLAEENPVRALETALALATPQDLICVTGSLYLVGEIQAACRPGFKDITTTVMMDDDCL